MISLVDITENFVADNVFLLKIKSNAILYKGMDFCKTFVQKNEDGEETAYIGILENSATCFCEECADFDELQSFLELNAIENIFCSEVFAKNTDKYAFSDIVLLKCKDEIKGEKVYEKTFFPDYKSIYKLLEDEFSLGDYNEFVSDLSFRLNHNSARVVKSDEGVVFTAWEDKNSAVISAIAVYITNRSKGIGSALLNSIIYDLKSENKSEIFVYCEEKATPFYLKNGFEIIEKIYTGKVS